MNVERIIALLDDSLGEIRDDHYPVDGCRLVDMYAVSLAVITDKVHEHAAEMIELLRDWPSEAWGAPIPALGQEINYLQAGGVLGDQGYAFLFFAFGKVLDWWDIRDPKTRLGLGIDNPLGRQLAGQGMISIIGYEPEGR